MPESLKIRRSFFGGFSNSCFKRRKYAKGCLIPFIKNIREIAGLDHVFFTKTTLTDRAERVEEKA